MFHSTERKSMAVVDSPVYPAPSLRWYSIGQHGDQTEGFEVLATAAALATGLELLAVAVAAALG